MFQHSINPENLTIKRTCRSLAVAGGVLGILLMTAGCTAQEQTTEEAVKPAPEVTEQVSIGQDEFAIDITTQYYQNGTRRVSMDYGTDTYADAIIVSYCEGGDLVEVADLYRGGGMERSIGHAACSDNRLTQQDFPPLPQ